MRNLRVLRLFIKEIADNFVRENFDRLRTHFNEDPFIKGNFSFFEVEFTSANTAGFTTPRTIPHKLGFLPRDVIHMSTRAADDAAITWHWDDFTATNIVVESDKAAIIRFYLGRYTEDSL